MENSGKARRTLRGNVRNMETAKKVRKGLRRERGSVAELLSTGILVLAMTVLMASCLESMQMLSQKEEVNQLARKYILRMETVGYLTGDDRTSLERELARIGVTGIDLSGTTMSEAGYGNIIYLSIHGSLPGKSIATGKGGMGGSFQNKQYPFHEIRTSTAKY